MTHLDRPAFLQLPEELLTDIVDACTASRKHCSLAYLKNLRLVHPRFAHLQRLKREIFFKVYLRPDPRRVEAKDAIKSIAPHVSHAIFEPVTLRRSTCQALNFSVMKARQLYERAVFDLVKGEAVKEMAAILALMTQLHSITVTQAKLSSDKDVMVPVGDSLLRLAIQSIALADVHVEDFFIEHRPHPDFDWSRRLPGWQGMAVSNLKNLRFHPAADTREEIAWQYHPDPFGQTPPPLVAGLEPDGTLTEFLQRCVSLEELSCCCPALVFGQSWQENQLLNLQLLRKLDLADCLIDGTVFGNWLLSCKKLNNLALTRLRPNSGDRLSDWRPVFDAVRVHENRLAVALVDIDVWAGLRWRLSLQHHTSGPAEAFTTCFPPKLCAHLKEYMTGPRDWISEDEQQADIGWA